MKIYLASDHAGFELKHVLFEHLLQSGYTVEDLGPATLNPEDDYPDFIRPCAERVADEVGSIGIVIGGSGQGEAMVANRVSGVRAAVYYGSSEDIVRLAREHNNANVLSLGARFIDHEEAKRAATLFIETAFSGDERHVRRIAKY